MKVAADTEFALDPLHAADEYRGSECVGVQPVLTSPAELGAVVDERVVDWAGIPKPKHFVAHLQQAHRAACLWLVRPMSSAVEDRGVDGAVVVLAVHEQMGLEGDDLGLARLATFLNGRECVLVCDPVGDLPHQRRDRRVAAEHDRIVQHYVGAESAHRFAYVEQVAVDPVSRLAPGAGLAGRQEHWRDYGMTVHRNVSFGSRYSRPSRPRRNSRCLAASLVIPSGS